MRHQQQRSPAAAIVSAKVRTLLCASLCFGISVPAVILFIFIFLFSVSLSPFIWHFYFPLNLHKFHRQLLHFSKATASSHKIFNPHHNSLGVAYPILNPSSKLSQTSIIIPQTVRSAPRPAPHANAAPSTPLSGLSRAARVIAT